MTKQYHQRVLYLLSIILAVFLCWTGGEAGETPLWPHESSDLPPDPAVTYGVFPNGFRYAIMPNTEPAEQISMRILFRAGSLMETEQQRGVAHFLEHMAFNGTTHYPAGEMVEYFQRLGMAFGADTNANTSFDRTIYQLELPNNSPELIRDSLQLLRDYTGGILLDPKEIEKERGIIFAEKRERDDWGYRTFVAQLNFLLPDTLLVNRLIIGEENIIRNATRQDFVDFYKKWYTSDRMVLFVVGEIQPDTLTPLIKEYFGDLEPRNPIPDPDRGKAMLEGISAKLHSEQDASVTKIRLWTGRPFLKEPDTHAQRISDLQLAMTNNMLSHRLDDLRKLEDAPFIGGYARFGDLFKLLDTVQIVLTCQPDQWEAALHTAEQELRRALQFGFTQAEVDEQKAIWLNGAEEYVKAAPTRLSGGLADIMVAAFEEDEVFLSPEAELDLVREVVAGFSPETAWERFRQAWEHEGRKIFISGNLELENAEETILMAYQKSQEVEVTPPEQQDVQPFAYTDFGTPGKIISRIEHEDLGITQIIFDNRVRLNLKPTDFEENAVIFDMRFGSGFLSLPADNPGLDILAESAFINGGLKAHSFDDMQRIFAGKSIGGGFSIGSDTFHLTGGTTPEDLREQLQFLCAYLIAPGYREEAFRVFRKGIAPMYTQLDHSIGGVWSRQIKCFLRSGDTRFCVPPEEELRQRTLKEVADWLKHPLKQGYLELSLVGDFELETAVEMVASTFGALPPREAGKPAFEKEREVHLLKEAQEKMFTYQTDDPRAEATIVWPTEDRSNLSRVYHLDLLAAILDDRLRVNIREKMGEAYSTAAFNTSSQTFPGFGFMEAYATVAPEKVELVADEIEKIADDLAQNGATQDEFERALAPILSDLKEAQEANGYWLNRVSGSQEFPELLDELRTIMHQYESASLDTVNALAKHYLSAEHGVKILIVPK